MAHISGTYFDPLPGRLRVTFSGQPYAGSVIDPGGPGSGSGIPELVLRAVVNGVGTQPINFTSNSTTMVLDYPGGVNWSVSTQEISHNKNGSSASSYGMRNLTITLELSKK